MSAFLHPFASPARTEFVEIVAGQGATVTDRDGKAYVDAMASLWYCNIGHGRAAVADAAATQMRTLAGFHAFEKFTNPPAEALCAQVAASAPAPGSRVFLTSSGSEAVDSALKLARLAHAVAGAPERTVIVSRAPSYHGVTYGGLAATGLPGNQQHFGPMLGDVVQLGRDDLSGMQELFAERGDRIAAVIAEPVIGAGGVYPPAPGYLAGLRALCDAHGAFLILDEVICGFGRLGSWWGAQRFGVRPDLQTFAKGVTSGYVPLGGVVVGPAVLDALAADPVLVLKHGHTYSGHPTACAAALAVHRIMIEEGLLDRALKVGARLADGLRGVADQGLCAEVRGDGAVWAVGFGPEDVTAGVTAPAVRDAMLERGVIPRPIGDPTLAFCPPLVITDAQIDRCVEALAESVRAVRGKVAA